MDAGKTESPIKAVPVFIPVIVLIILTPCLGLLCSVWPPALVPVRSRILGQQELPNGDKLTVINYRHFGDYWFSLDLLHTHRDGSVETNNLSHDDTTLKQRASFTINEKLKTLTVVVDNGEWRDIPLPP